MNVPLDPRTKLALAVAFTAALVSTSNLGMLITATAIVCLLVIVLGHVRRWLSALRTLVPMTLFVFVVMSFTFDLSSALGAALRLAAVATAFFLFFQSTAPEDLADALQKMGAPYVFAFILTTAMQFVPVLTRQMQDIMDAQRARGIRLEHDLASLPNYPALFAPLLIQSFTLADHLAEAMEARGFGAPHRTFQKEYALRLQDYATIVLALAFVIISWQIK